MSSRRNPSARGSFGPFRIPFAVFTVVLCLLAAFAPAGAAGPDGEVRIGVLAHRPKPEVLKRWEPTAEYLSARVPGVRFRIVPLDYAEMDRELPAKNVDFIVTNPSHYILMMHRYGLSRVATLVEREGGVPLASFGGVVAVRSSDAGLREVCDLKGKTVAAPDNKSLGGYQVQAALLREQGVRLPQDAKMLFTDMPHDRAVEAVLAGKADAAFVRTGVVDKMIAEGKVGRDAIRVLNPQARADFPLLLSTRLYPNWPFAVMPHVEDGLAKAVTVALLSMPDDGPAAQAGSYHGWDIPADYESVRMLLETLRMPPYDRPVEFSLADVLRKHGAFVAGVILFVATLAAFSLRLRTLNGRLRQEVEGHLQANAELTEAMAKVKLLSGFLPICASCKKIRDDQGYWKQVEDYIRDHSEAVFSHGICPDCSVRIYGVDYSDGA
jgi:ABC-type phosphate/phosphonate transport system substrate-binding protein